MSSNRYNYFQMPSFTSPTPTPMFSTSSSTVPSFNYNPVITPVFNPFLISTNNFTTQNICSDFSSQTLNAFIKNDIPPTLKTFGVTVAAVSAGLQIADSSKNKINSGTSLPEAVICQTAKILTTELVGGSLKSAVAASVPLFGAAVTANPNLSVAIPAFIPTAYNTFKAADIGGQISGNVAEAICESSFAAARQLSKGAK